jgi:hypothetical protein
MFPTKDQERDMFKKLWANNGFMSPSFPEPLSFTYRGHSRVWATLAYLDCSNCCNRSTDSIETILEGYKTEEEAFQAFKREVNIKISMEEVV